MNSKHLFTFLFLITNIFNIMETQAQSVKTIDAKTLQFKVYNASENSFGVASVIISGKTDAVLIDAQFTLADAEIVAKEIKASGKKLTTIYVSHGDPDFYFGLEVFKKYFPEVTVYATPLTVEHIQKTAQKKLDVWGERLGAALTSNIVLPQVLKDNSITLEGHQLEIYGLETFPERTFVWIPSVKAVVGGINVFGNTFHLWTADSQTKEARANWISILEKIEALHPAIVIPAHAKNGAAFSVASVQYDIAYLKTYEAEVAQTKSSEELISAMKKHYPEATFDIALQIGAKVNKGEMKW